MKEKGTENNFKVLRIIKNNPNLSQRELASNLDFSLGKLNYCLKALKEKGLVKMKNFSSNSNKIGYAYILTPKGIREKTKLTIKEGIESKNKTWPAINSSPNGPESL